MFSEAKKQINQAIDGNVDDIANGLSQKIFWRGLALGAGLGLLVAGGTLAVTGGLQAVSGNLFTLLGAGAVSGLVIGGGASAATNYAVHSYADKAKQRINALGDQQVEKAKEKVVEKAEELISDKIKNTHVKDLLAERLSKHIEEPAR